MDAISFVLGIKSSQLRSSQLRDLIYRGRILKESNGMNGRDEEEDDEDDEPTQTQTQRSNGDGEETAPRRAWVMAVYQQDSGREIRYKRTYDHRLLWLTEESHLLAEVSIGLIRGLSVQQNTSKLSKSITFSSKRAIFLSFRFVTFY
jgi:hypothetical protein